MVVSVTDVRDYLNKLSEQRVPSEVIEKQIAVATTQIENSIAAGVRLVDKDNAILAYAGYLTYQAYCTEYERATGSVPGFMTNHLAQLGSMANSLITLTRKGNPVYVAPVASNTSLEDLITEPYTVGI